MRPMPDGTKDQDTQNFFQEEAGVGDVSVSKIKRENFKSDEPCCACGLQVDGMVCYHHLKTQKAHSELRYEDYNHMPVCQKHHVEIHNTGAISMAEKFPGVERWLKMNEWYICDLMGRWTHDKEC